MTESWRWSTGGGTGSAPVAWGSGRRVDGNIATDVGLVLVLDVVRVRDVIAYRFCGSPRDNDVFSILVDGMTIEPF